MAVDLLAGLRASNAQLVQSNLELAAREERERARRAAEKSNRMANIGALAGAAIGTIGGPAGIAIGASIGNMAGRALGGGPAPSVAEVASAGASLYGLSADQSTTAQNTKINQALTQNAISELQGTLPAGVTPESAAGAESSQRLEQTFAPDYLNGSPGQEINVATNTVGPSESDERVAGLLGPGMSAQAPPTAEQRKTLDSIQLLQGMQSDGLGRISPQTVATVADRVLGKKEQKKEDLYVVKNSAGEQVAAGLNIKDAQSAKAQNKGSSIYRMAVEPTDRSSTAGTEFERVRPQMEAYNAKVAAGEPITPKEHSDYALNYSKYSRPEYAQDAAGTRYVVREGLNFKDLGYSDPPNMQDVYKRAKQPQAGDQEQAPAGDVARVSPDVMNAPKVAQKGIASPDAKNTAAASLAVGKSLDTVFKNLDVFGDVPLSNVHRRVGKFLGQDQPAIEVKNALDSMVNDFAQAAKGTQTEGDVARFKDLTGDLNTPVRQVVTAAKTIARKLAIQSNAAFADAVAENRKPSYSQGEAVKKFSQFEPISVTNKQLYDALPSGTYYTDSKGNRARKP